MSSTGVRPNDGDMKSRNGREYTKEQHQAVLRVMRCSSTAYYEILAVEKSCTDSQVKKAYRKLALTMHPDKNSAPQADEAFKRVSKAFQVLSDPDKKRVYDQTGSDPESRQAPPGFQGGSMFHRNGGARYQEADIDPNDIFNMFFGGQSPFGPMGGMGGMGGGGPQVFSFNGHSFQYGGNQARRRARQETAGRAADQEPPSWTQYIPFIGIVIVMLIVQLFSGDSSTSAAKMPRFSFTHRPPYIQERRTPNYKVQFFVNPREVRNTNAGGLRRLDRYAETTFVNNLRQDCDKQYEKREQALRDAQGWFSRDEDAYQTALAMDMPACERLTDMGLGFGH